MRKGSGICMASLVEKYGWTEWLCHTHFSFKWGASHPLELVTCAAAYKYHGLTIADFDGVYGLARSWQALKTLRRDGLDQGLKLIFGAEIHLRKDHSLPLNMQDTLVLFARSHRGYFNLCRLLTYAHRDGKNDADVPFEYLLQADVADLVAIQPMRGLIHQGDLAALQQKCQRLHALFGKDQFYFAAGRYFNPSEDHALRTTLHLSRDLDISCLLTQDVFFHDSKQKPFHDLLHAIRLNKVLGEVVQHLFVNGEHCLHDLPTIERQFGALPIYEQSLRLSRDLAESCQFDLSELRYHYPKEMLPEGFTAQEFLTKLTYESAHRYYGPQLPDKLAKLLAHELALVEQLGFADYFLTVWDIVRWARGQGILCQGRGSAANSAVCFVLGITALDPTLFEVLFERFISVERGDPPDIDVDFEHERREEVIQYIYERYGRAQAAMVANIITFQSRGALRAVGKAMGVPELILGRAADILDSREFRHGGMEATLKELQSSLDEEGVLDNYRDLPWQMWAHYAGRLYGFPSHMGIHSGGFIVADKSLDWLVPQEPATMEGRSVVQWCKEDIEALGFFKIDILALGMLTALRKCFSLIREHEGKDLTLASIPADDRATYEMICRADTVGTFQIESRAQMSMLPRLKPRCFYDLVVEVAIIRPGPIQGGMIPPFLRRRSGQEAVTFPDKRLEPILKRTLGVPIFQEQVMRIAMSVGGFSPGEADEMRRHMGSFSMKGDVSRWMSRLATGMESNGISRAFIQVILEQLKGFSSYGFPESHAASFALLAYASSYLKCHYPAAFFVAILNSQPMGFYAPHVLLQTARHLGVEVRPVCVHHSAWDNTLEGKAIRMGLRFVNCLREAAARELVKVREKSEIWTTLTAFLQQVRISRVDLTALAAANALQVFGLSRRAALWLAEAAPFAAFMEDDEEPIAFRMETSHERMRADFQATSTSLGPHPCTIFKEEEWCYECEVKSLCLASHVASIPSGKNIVAFGMVIVRQAPPTAHGMVFATIEDETGLLNLVFTPQIYAQYRRLFDRQSFLCIRGTLQKQGDAHSVKVGHIFAPQLHEADVVILNTLSKEVAEDLVVSRNYC